MGMQTWGSSSSQPNPVAMRDWGSTSVPLLGAQEITPPAMNLGFLNEVPSFNSAPKGFGDYMSDFGGMFGGFLGKKNADGSMSQGWGMPAISGLSALASGYLGFKQLGLAQHAQAEAEKQFNMNWGAQQKTVNSQLQDRQAARVASNPGAYQAIPEYMKANGI